MNSVFDIIHPVTMNEFSQNVINTLRNYYNIIPITAL